MIYLEKKVAIFKDMVYYKKEEQAKEKIQQTTAAYDKLLEEKKLELDQQEKDLVARREDLAKRQGIEKLSSLKEKNRMEVLAKEEALFKDLDQSLRQLLRDFKKSKDYLNVVGDKLEEILIQEEKGTFILQTLKEEDHLKDALVNRARALGFTLKEEPLDPVYLGGFILGKEDESYLYNRTLARDLEDHRYAFGARLHKALKEEGNQR